MTKAPTPTEMSKGQSDNTNNATKKFDYTAVLFVNMFVILCNIWKMDSVTVYGHAPEYHVIFGRGDFILFDQIPISTIAIPNKLFETFLDINHKSV